MTANYEETEEAVYIFEQRAGQFNEQVSLLYERETDLLEWAESGGSGCEVEVQFVLDRCRKARDRLERLRQEVLIEGNDLETEVRDILRDLQEQLDGFNISIHREREGGSWSGWFLRNIERLAAERAVYQRDEARWQRLLARIISSLRVCRRQAYA